VAARETGTTHSCDPVVRLDWFKCHPGGSSVIRGVHILLQADPWLIQVASRPAPGGRGADPPPAEAGSTM